MNIEEIDKNFKLPELNNLSETSIYDTKKNKDYLYGLMADDIFKRMPTDTAINVNEGVKELYTHTAGGRVRFMTDSDFLTIIAKCPYISNFYHMPRTASSGFDIYINDVFSGIIAPALSDNTEFGGTIQLGKGMKEITVNFPLYNAVNDLFIGLKKGAVLKKASDYKISKPIVFYGSSITQGGCVSRPGLSYISHISRMLNLDYINLGFSGSCKAEKLMGEYISNIPMSAFIYDYDHNAPTAEHLKNTHESFFKQIREKNKELPIIMISMPNFKAWSQHDAEAPIQRRNIIKETYENAVKAGDKNVYFIDGELLFGEKSWDSCTVDGAHPNDLGQYRMAEVIAPIIKAALK